MAKQRPSIPQGTRDFSPVEMTRRTYMLDTIKQVFREHGFLPLETPAMEHLTTLLGKYGDEGDRLLFKILNSGDFAKNVEPEELKNPGALAMKICDRGLRYDLTVPLARYVVQYQSDIAFPFRRYQIQPVWRADRPQKGRYREFYQCDVDIIGSNSLLNEVELVQIVEKVFGRLNVNVTLKLNNRKILYGISESIGYAEKMMDITVAIDKLDKIGLKAVNEELYAKGISKEAVAKLEPILELSGSNREKLAKMKEIIGSSEVGLDGIAEMETMFNYIEALECNLNIEIDLSLARGLNYYTGVIFEVEANDFEIGSICGGGRYDDLTGIFGMPNTSGVGISFGADRIYDVMLGLDLFPEEATIATKAIFINFGKEEEMASVKLLAELRNQGIPSEIYPEDARIRRQMDYANRREIPYVIMIGGNELETRKATVRNMKSGEQFEVSFDELAQKLK